METRPVRISKRMRWRDTGASLGAFPQVAFLEKVKGIE